MKEHNEFDKLARRKLEERDHAFQDAHWAEMEKLIDAGGKKRRGGYWLIPVLLLLLGGGTWIFNEREEKTIGNSEVASVGTTVESEAENELIDDADQPAVVADEAPIQPLKNADPSSEERVAEVKESPIGTQIRRDEAEPIEVTPEEKTGPIALNHQRERSEQNRTGIPAGSNGSDRPVEPDHDAIEMTSVISDPTEIDPIVPAYEEKNHMIIRSTDDQGNSDPFTQEHDPIEKSENDPTTDLSSEEQNDPNATIDPRSAENGSAIVEDRRNDASNEGIDPASAIAEPVVTTPTEDQLTSDTSGTSAPQIATNDSAALATPEPTPIIDPRSPFELSILGGSMFTTSHYSGPLSQDWNSTIEPQQTLASGVEIMRMGRNFGIGSGLHYSTYAERIITQQLDRSESAEHHYYFLSPVDTTLLIITDSTFVNGEWYYTGESIYTTVHVLDEGYETITTNTRVRDARDQVNRTSYLEIPLLLDAHLTQGRWSLGLRGGPTLGVLTMHRGSVPHTDAGYLDLADQDLRSLVIGYTARAYIRHRFNAGWSIGLEPMIGGHLMNSFADDALVRKPSSFGGMLSLTYRIK